MVKTCYKGRMVIESVRLGQENQKWKLDGKEDKLSFAQQNSDTGNTWEEYAAFGVEDSSELPLVTAQCENSTFTSNFAEIEPNSFDARKYLMHSTKDVVVTFLPTDAHEQGTFSIIQIDLDGNRRVLGKVSWKTGDGTKPVYEIKLTAAQPDRVAVYEFSAVLTTATAKLLFQKNMHQ